MTVVTKNLGLARAIEVGTTEPSNLNIIWFDDNVGQKVHKTYSVASGIWKILGGSALRGTYDAATNTPDLDVSPDPSIENGWAYRVTVPGTFFTTSVIAGDIITALSDSPTAESDWVITPANFTTSDEITEGVTHLFLTSSERNEISTLAATYISYIGAIADVNLNNKNLTNVASLGIGVSTSSLPLEIVSDNGTVNPAIKSSSTLGVYQHLFEVGNKEMRYVTKDNGVFILGRTISNVGYVRFAALDSGLTIQTSADDVTYNDALRIDSNGNVGIGTLTPNASSILDLTSTTKAFIPTRWSTAEMTAIVSPVNGMMGYNNTTHTFYGYQNGGWASIGSNFFTDGGAYTYLTSTTDLFQVGSSSSLGSSLGVKGQGATSATTNFLLQNSAGTQLGIVKDDGSIALGVGASSTSNGVAWGNIAKATATGVSIGYYTGRNATGIQNTCVGFDAGSAITTSPNNTLIGAYAGNAILGGNGFNTVVGVIACGTVTSGQSNAMFGYGAGNGSSTTSSQNSYYGVYAGSARNGNYNTAMGFFSGGTTTGSSTSGVYYGAYSGTYETGSQKLFIDGLDRTSEALGRTNSIIYGVMDATASNQTLALNAVVTATYGLATRIQAVTSAATVTPVCSTDDEVIITAQAEALTLANPSGTGAQGQAMIIRIKDNATARAISYGTQYRAVGVTLPTTTVISKTLYIGMIYNATDTKWDVVGINQEA